MEISINISNLNPSLPDSVRMGHHEMVIAGSDFLFEGYQMRRDYHGSGNPNWRGGKTITIIKGKSYVLISSKNKLEHQIIVEKALGKKIPIGCDIHHFDENGLNNGNRNLVLCNNRKYHMLLHVRMRALRACGHVNWKKCQICKKWDDPKNLYVNPNNRSVHHRYCDALRARKYRRIKKENKE